MPAAATRWAGSSNASAHESAQLDRFDEDEAASPGPFTRRSTRGAAPWTLVAAHDERLAVQVPSC